MKKSEPSREVVVDWTEDVRQGLLAPFPAEQIAFLPRSPREGRALALPHIDARDVMNRLDEVVGPGGWAFHFDVVDGIGKKVKGTLTVLGVTKSDAGEASEEDEPLKAAVSDALKRCAVHFGVGRYLYCLRAVWAPFDQTRRHFAQMPQIPHADLARALATCGYQGEMPGAGGAEAHAGGHSLAHALEEPGEDSGTTCQHPGCGKPVTVGQQAVSQKAFGTTLCPAHQRLAARG